VKLYGSFRQHGSYCLILEYADGGDLGKYFCNIPAPSTPEDVMLFWKSLFQVFWGLDRIHQLRYNRDVPIKGLHQDIRPENILLVRGTSGSPYDFTPKIADFGLYSPVRTAKARASGSMGLDRYGSQRYSETSQTSKLAAPLRSDKVSRLARVLSLHDPAPQWNQHDLYFRRYLLDGCRPEPHCCLGSWWA